MACGRMTELTIATPNTGAVEKDLLFTCEEFACQLAYHEPLFPLEPKRLAFRRMSFTARSTSTWSKQVGPYDFASPMGNLEDAMKLQQYGFALTAIAGVIVGGAAVQNFHAQFYDVLKVALDVVRSSSTASLSGGARCWHSYAYFSLFASLFFFLTPNRFVR